MTVVVFDSTAFLARYPEFSAVSVSSLQAYFQEAGFYLSNDDDSIVKEIPRRAALLNMLTAHIGYLAGALEANAAPKPVGRIAQAAEGSVSVSLEYAPPGSLTWFNQTTYGAAFIQATQNLRSFRYAPRPTRF
jgi:hypothetical protein